MPRPRNNAKTKVCTRCKKLLPNNDQYFDIASVTRKNGTKDFALRGVCKKCRNKGDWQLQLKKASYLKAVDVVAKMLKEEGIG